jgi:hypothetical protein
MNTPKKEAVTKTFKKLEHIQEGAVGGPIGKKLPKTKGRKVLGI